MTNQMPVVPVRSTLSVGKYFQNVYFKFNRMDNFGLALDDVGELKGEKRVFLRDLFVTPNLSNYHLDAARIIEDENNPSKANSLQWQSVVDILEKNPHIFVLGDPGAGKSTLIQWLMLAFAYSSDNLTKMRVGELVPFAFILRELPLHDVKSFDDLWRVFVERNADLMQAFTQYPESYDVLEALLKNGQALILLDGLDEITHAETRENLGKAVLEGIQKYPDCRFVITSRVIGFDQAQWFGYKKENILEENYSPDKNSFNLPVFYLAPFTYKQAQQFVGNWYQQYHPSTDGNHAQRVQDLFVRIQQNDGLGRLSRTPVLLNMICFVHARRGRLPDGRAELYQRIAETYLVSLDSARGIQQCSPNNITLDYSDRSALLSAVAFNIQKRRNDENESTLFISVPEVQRIFKEKLSELGAEDAQLDDEVQFLLNQFQTRSGLFIPRGRDEDGNEVFGFNHLSFLEFFAAKAIQLQLDAGDLEISELKEYTLFPSWQEAFVLFFEQIEQAKVVERYIDALFDFNLNYEWEEKEKYFPLVILSSIAMDSGTKITPKKRKDLIEKLWGFYLSEEKEWQLVSVFNNLWQDNFESKSVGIHFMQVVKRLYLDGSNINDIYFLSSLTQLQELYLHNTQIKDISVLSNLTQLQVLFLGDTKIKDISVLSSLTQLKRLSLVNTQINDISALSGLTQLQILSLVNTQIKDISALSSLTQLQYLSLRNTQVKDISPLAHLKDLYISR